MTWLKSNKAVENSKPVPMVVAEAMARHNLAVLIKQRSGKSTTEPKQPGERWAIWEWFHIKGQDDSIYLSRLRLIQTPAFGIYLHFIKRPDQDPYMHDHPWDFVSIPLRGSYVEWIPNDRHDFSRGAHYRRVRQFQANFKRATDYHKIVDIYPGMLTLVLVGPKRKKWGFWVRDRWVLWSEYLEDISTRHLLRNADPATVPFNPGWPDEDQPGWKDWSEADYDDD